jgi:hypothetical protein
MGRTLAVLKSKGIAISVQFNLLRMYLRLYWSYPLFWIKVAPILFVPNVVFGLAEKMYRWLRKRKEALRSGETVKIFE